MPFGKRLRPLVQTDLQKIGIFYQFIALNKINYGCGYKTECPVEYKSVTYYVSFIFDFFGM